LHQVQSLKLLLCRKSRHFKLHGSSLTGLCLLQMITFSAFRILIFCVLNANLILVCAQNGTCACCEGVQTPKQKLKCPLWYNNPTRNKCCLKILLEKTQYSCMFLRISKESFQQIAWV
jgi:hypothetical protein